METLPATDIMVPLIFVQCYVTPFPQHQIVCKGYSGNSHVSFGYLWEQEIRLLVMQAVGETDGCC